MTAAVTLLTCTGWPGARFRCFTSVFWKTKTLRVVLKWWLSGAEGVRQSSRQIRVLSVLRQTSRASMYRSWCTLTEACLQDFKLPATSSSPPGGRLRLRGFFYLQECVSLMNPSSFSPSGICEFVARGWDVCRWASQSWRNNLGTKQATAIFCKTVVYGTSSAGEKKLASKRQNNFS